MKKIGYFKLGSIALLTAFCFGVMIWFLEDKYQPKQFEIPNASWEKIFFKEINNVTRLSNIQELREKNLLSSNIEIRIWRGFGLSKLEGIIVKRTNQKWSALHIKGNNYTEITETTVTNLNAPKSGWDSFWEKIEERGILTLPDASQIDCEAIIIDGTSYVIETNHQKKYRVYRYNSEVLKCTEAEKAAKIGEIFAEEFDDGIGICKTAEWIPCARLNREKSNK